MTSAIIAPSHEVYNNPADPAATGVGGVAPGHNFNRLAAMIYPPRPSANGTIPASSPPQRTLTFHYGDSGSGATTSEQFNHLAGRVSRLEDSVLGPRLAAFEYAGSMRRVSFNCGWNQALLAGVGAFAIAQGFDAAGRLADALMLTIRSSVAPST